jgi:hypothetical protein
MSSKTQALIVAIIAVIAISGIYILTKSRPVENPSNVSVSSSSQIASFSSSKAVLSSSSVIVSSSSTGVSKVVEAPKTSEVAIVPKPQAQCNLPESENLVKTEEGCFTFSVGGRILGQNIPTELETKFLNAYFPEISKNYYQKIKSKFISKEKYLEINYIKKIDENDFEFYIGMTDFDYYLQKYGNAPGDYSPINQAKYSITKNPVTGNWSYQFIKFENLN